VIVQTVFQGTFFQIQGTAYLAIQVGTGSRYPPMAVRAVIRLCDVPDADRHRR
jgi:hypothetical protein